MSLPSQDVRQRDFSAGQIDSDADRRDDTDIFKFGVRQGRNLQFVKAGPLERRSGRDWLYNDDGVRDEFRPLGDETYSITFGVNRFTVRNSVGDTLQVLAAPWTDVSELVWELYDNLVFVCGPFHTQVIEIDRQTRVWSIRDYAFSTGIGSKVFGPFYRFDHKGATMQPSAITGSITLTFSQPLLTAQHIGLIMRYAGRQLQITGVSSATVATANVLERLNPTVKWTLPNPAEAATFAVGHIVETSDSNIQAEVVAVGSNFVTGVVLNRYREWVSNERLVGPVSDALTSGAVTDTPGATVQWDEIFVSDYRGWPRSVSSDAERVIFCDFPQEKRAVLWTSVNDPFNVLIGAEATGAIFELPQADCRVFHVIGGYDEFVITDVGVFYIPISADNPLKPGSVEFRRIYTGELSRVRPVQVTEGVLFVDVAQTGIYAITATGQTARPYVASEITEYHRSLFNGIKSLAASSGTPKAASRQIFVVNDDGTMVIGQYNSDRGYVGWLPWDSQGTVHAVSARFGDVVVSSVYPAGPGTIAVAERINYDALLDCSITASGGSFVNYLELSGGEPLSLLGDDFLTLSGFRTQFLAGSVLQVLADGFYLGNATIGPGGELTGFDQFNMVTVGYSFDWNLEPNIPAFEGGESFGQRLRRRKISKIMIKVKDTQEFRCGNKLLAGYEGGDDTSLPMPLRTGVYQARQVGRDYDPTYELKQSFPCRFKLQELTTEVTV